MESAMSMVYVVALVAAVAAVLLLSGAVRLATLKLLSGAIRGVPGSSVPDECVEDLVQAEKFLRRNGFSFQSHVRRDAIISGQKWGLYGAVYFHQESNTWAMAYVEPVQHVIFPWRVCFLTPCSRNNVVCTISGGEFPDFPVPAPFTVQDPLVYSSRDQWRIHREKSSSALVPDPPRFELTEVLNAFEFVHFQGLVDSSVLVKRDDGYRLPLRHAIQVAKRYKRVIRELAKQKAAVDNAGSSVDAGSTASRLATNIRSYQTYRDIKQHNTAGRLTKTGILLASVLVFAVSFGLTFSIDTVVILIVVLLVHEAGHLLGMWMFGYKDLSMLFVPFMGALASGKKDQVKAWQETVILLLGPVPGYVAGVLILAGVFGEVPVWLYEFAFMALILNLFNLLPFMPLDGGKIFNLALFSRLPRAQVAFMLMSILAFFYVGIAWDMHIVLALALAVLLAIGVPFLVQEAQLLRAVLQQNQGRPLQGVEDLMKALEGIPAWKNIAQEKRWLLLDSLRDKIQHHASGIRASALILAVWVFSVVAPPYFSVSADTRTQLASVAAMLFGHAPEFASIDELKERYQHINDHEEKAQLAAQLASRLYREGFSEAETYLEDMKTIASSADLPLDVRGDHYARIARICELYQQSCATEFLERAVDVYRTSDDLIDRALSPLYSLASSGDQPFPTRVSYLDELETLAKKAGQTSLWLPASYSLRASIAYEQGQYTEVERWLTESIGLAEQYPEVAANDHWKALVNYYYQRGDTAKAIDAAQRWESTWIPDSYAVDALAANPQYVLAWLFSDNDLARANEYIPGIKVESAAEKFELLLAGWVLDQQMATEDIQSRLLQNEALIAQIDEEYGWYLLSYRTLELTSEHGGSAESFNSRQLMLDRHWYGKIAELLERPEFAVIEARIKEHYEQTTEEFDEL